MPETLEAPAIAGVTQAARAAREAEMRPLSKENEAIMPSLAEIGSFLRLPKPAAKAPVVEEEQPEVDELNPELPVEEDEVPEVEDLNQEDEPPVEEEEEAPEPEAPKEPVQKRIDQLTAQKSALADELAEVKQQLARAQRQPSESDPLAHIGTSEELAAEVARAKSVRAMAMQNRYGMTAKDEQGNDVEYNEAQMTSILLNAESTIEAAVVKREQLIAMDADHAALLKVAPKLAESGHEHTAYVEKILAHEGPEIRRMAARAKMSPHRIAYALALGLNQLSQPTLAALPATRPANQQRKAPPIPTPRTANRAPAGQIQQRAAKTNTTAIANGKPGALVAALQSFL